MPTETGPASGLTTLVLITHLAEPQVNLLSRYRPPSGLPAPRVARAGEHAGSPSALLCFGLEQLVVPPHQALISAPGPHAVCREWGGTSGVHERSSGGLTCAGTSLRPQGLQEMSTSPCLFSYHSCSVNLIPLRCFDYTYPHVCPATRALEMTNHKLLLPLKVAWAGPECRGNNQQANKAALMGQSREGTGPAPRHTTGFPSQHLTFCTQLVRQPLHKFFTFQMWKQTSPRAENCVKFA